MGILTLFLLIALYQLPLIIRSKPDHLNLMVMVQPSISVDAPGDRISIHPPPVNLRNCGPVHWDDGAECRPSQKPCTRLEKRKGGCGSHSKQGSCGGVCKHGMRCCGGICVDVREDIRNCGKCRNVCGADEKCVFGMCGYG